MGSEEDARGAMGKAGHVAAEGRRDRQASSIPLLVFGAALLIGCGLTVHVDRQWFALPFWVLVGPVAYLVAAALGRRRTEQTGVEVFGGRRPQALALWIVVLLGAAFPYPLVWGMCGAVLVGVLGAALRSHAVRLAALAVLIGGVVGQLVVSSVDALWALPVLYGVLGAGMTLWGLVMLRREVR
ncbi:hypothetical protein ACIBTP_42185 [Streptomyces avidinii]|uniref:hypothetical protein n=1 Tax=Streptomyces avidinii TaxID=1895 RepID=UPI00378E1C41